MFKGLFLCPRSNSIKNNEKCFSRYCLGNSNNTISHLVVYVFIPASSKPTAISLTSGHGKMTLIFTDHPGDCWFLTVIAVAHDIRSSFKMNHLKCQTKDGQSWTDLPRGEQNATRQSNNCL